MFLCSLGYLDIKTRLFFQNSKIKSRYAVYHCYIQKAQHNKARGKIAPEVNNIGASKTPHNLMCLPTIQNQILEPYYIPKNCCVPKCGRHHCLVNKIMFYLSRALKTYRET